MALLSMMIFVACVATLPNAGAERAPDFECLEACNNYLFPDVADNKLTASSFWSGYICDATQSRLDNKYKNSKKVGAWVVPLKNKDQYIQVELNNVTKIRGITTQGRPKGPLYTTDESKRQWVKTYTISYSLDGVTFTTVKDANGSNDMVFNGNSDADTKVTNKLPKTVWAKFVRLNPQSWNQYISLRWDLVGC